MILERSFDEQCFWKNHGKLRKNRDIKLVTPNQEGVIWYQNQTIIQHIFFRTFISHRK